MKRPMLFFAGVLLSCVIYSHSLHISCDLKMSTGDYIELYANPFRDSATIQESWFNGHKVF